MDDDELFEQLAKAYPDLMQKSRQEHLGVGEGWFTIIKTLCGLISYRVSQARYKIGYALENPGSKYIKPMEELEAELAAAIEELPVIDQIKEKFGGLRFYYSGGDDRIENYVGFAEAMAYHTCEECGAPGEARNTGWVKVRCDKHHKEHEERENPGNYPSRTKPPKLDIE